VRRRVVKVYLSNNELEMLDKLCETIGEDRSRIINHIILDFLERTNLLKEKIHSGKKI